MRTVCYNKHTNQQSNMLISINISNKEAARGQTGITVNSWGNIKWIRLQGKCDSTAPKGYTVLTVIRCNVVDWTCDSWLSKCVFGTLNYHALIKRLHANKIVLLYSPRRHFPFNVYHIFGDDGLSKRWACQVDHLKTFSTAEYCIHEEGDVVY